MASLVVGTLYILCKEMLGERVVLDSLVEDLMGCLSVYLLLSLLESCVSLSQPSSRLRTVRFAFAAARWQT